MLPPLPSPQAAAAQQTIASYTFAGATGTPTSAAADVTTSEFVRDGADNTFYDNTAGNPAPDADGEAWTTAAALDPALYYTPTSARRSSPPCATVGCRTWWRSRAIYTPTSLAT